MEFGETCPPGWGISMKVPGSIEKVQVPNKKA